MTAPARFDIDLTDGQMAGYRWTRDGAPRLLFAHANGFTATTYRQILAPLCAKYEVIAVDLRGHGRTRLSADPAALLGWDVYARDLAAVIATLDDRPLAVAGHSMGAVSLLLASARRGTQVAGLALIEPVILQPYVYGINHTPFGQTFSRQLPLVKTALARFDGWDKRSDAVARYKDRPTFRRWAPGLLEDYLEDGLTEREGRWHLSCRPDWEAANFAAQRHWPIRAARSLNAPMHVLKAEHASTVMNETALLRAGAQLTKWAGTSHLLPMERPAETAAWLDSQCERFFSVDVDPPRP